MAVYYSAARYKSHGRPSCGVAVFYKQHMRGYFNRIFTDFQFGVVFELPGQMFGCINSVILVAIYLPPDSSPRYEGGTIGIEVLEELLLRAKCKYGDVLFMVLGDLSLQFGNL